MFTEAVDNFVDNRRWPAGTRRAVPLRSELPTEWALKTFNYKVLTLEYALPTPSKGAPFLPLLAIFGMTGQYFPKLVVGSYPHAAPRFRRTSRALLKERFLRNTESP